MLSSFEITNFRTFSHLRIERLGRVNLIVGKNNVGKTTLLEALHVYAADNPKVIQLDLTSHDELLFPGTSGEIDLDYRSLFHGREATREKITLGPVHGGAAGAAPDGKLVMELVPMDRVEDSEDRYDFHEMSDWDEEPEGEIVPGLCVRRNKGPGLVSQPRSPRRTFPPYHGAVYVRAEEVPSGVLGHWWDSIAGTDYEREAIESVSIVVPLELVRLVRDPTLFPGRVFLVRIQGETEPVPLKSLGGGPLRMFQIATAIAYSARMSAPHQQIGQRDSSDSLSEVPEQRAKVLLIDEIENGIHYTLHTKLWRFVFGLAQRHNLQVFATSHSWDCMKGFAEAVAEDEAKNGLVIRLEKVEGEQQTGAVIIDREGLPIVVRDSIEVR